MRRGFRVGDHLVMDDESGLVHYASEMVKCWDGSLRRKYEGRNPQEFVQAGTDPKPLVNIRPDSYPTVRDFYTLVVGETNVPAPTGPASHLFDVGIGSMEIGGNFVVR